MENHPHFSFHVKEKRMDLEKSIDKSFAITTLGCKLNQYESECIRHNLLKEEWEYREFEQSAGFYIINTCTVTAKTDSRCRNAIRRARRISPDAIILVTGCYAETQPEKLGAMQEVNMVIGNNDKDYLPSIMDGFLKGNGETSIDRRSLPTIPANITDFFGHSRAFIKVQEGCDSSCSYCIIPQARGKSRSTEPDAIIRQVATLVDNAFEEIVLTGIHIGRYGKDIEGSVDLEGLIRKILGKIRNVRIRLSSIEPNEVTDGLVDLVATSARVASHFHIPLQSGDDEILRSMKRPYSTGKFSELVKNLKKYSEEIIIGTDIIVGFPGETESHFKNTYAYLKALPVDYFHVFSYSKRPGTPAEKMPGQVHPDDKKSRSKRLIRLGKIKKRAFMNSRTGKRELVLIQGPDRNHSRFSIGLTGNYCEVSLKCPTEMTGKLKQVDITHFSRGRLYGRLSVG